MLDRRPSTQYRKMMILQRQRQCRRSSTMIATMRTLPLVVLFPILLTLMITLVSTNVDGFAGGAGGPLAPSSFRRNSILDCRIRPKQQQASSLSYTNIRSSSSSSGILAVICLPHITNAKKNHRILSSRLFNNNDNNDLEEDSLDNDELELVADVRGRPAGVVMEDLHWRVEKLRLEEANTRRFLKAGPRFLPYEECRKWVQAWGQRWESASEW